MSKVTELRAHPFADLFPMMGGEDEAELRASMRAHGYDRRFPVVIYGGRILDGRNRYAVARSMGLEPSLEVFKGDDDAALAYVLAANLARRHLSPSQRAMVAACLVTSSHGGDRRSDQAAALPLVTQYEAASRLGVSERSVRAAVKVRAADPDLAEAVTRGEVTVADAEAKVRPHVARSSGEVEWWTPDEILEAVRAVLGRIDLDPASCRDANKRVRAVKYYDEKADGLAQVWEGKVWLNPPYDGRCGRFVSRLLAFRAQGQVTEAITLTNNATETRWGQMLLEEASAVCFPNERLSYVRPSGDARGNPLQGQMLCYFGEVSWRFEQQFQRFGAVVHPAKNQQLVMDFEDRGGGLAVGDVVRWCTSGVVVGTVLGLRDGYATIREPDGRETEAMVWHLARVSTQPVVCVPARLG